MPELENRSSDRCASAAAPARTLALPVLPSGNRSNRHAWSQGHAQIKHSRMGKWRAAVLILVHVVMIAHIIQWLITGLTLSPVEPSESMHTLRDGVVNAGFVFFLLAIASTLILGRFFCGWGCHVVALQDLCAWLMGKLGVRPKPFRSRLLIYVPLLLALYMFVWPVVAREVLRPLLADASGRLPDWMGQIEPLAGIHTDFIVRDYWATFPPWYVAIPFLLVCGFATVYFLGSKGFCTYGCPYGGFFGPADLVAPGKIRVNDNCHQCGHCTAVCTSNVRVHEEVHTYGMVVDPGCMKCLDCVSVCPNNALSFAMGKPTILAKPKPGREEAAAKARVMREARYDFTRAEELVFGLCFLGFFMSYRGLLNQVPMLMAVAMAGIMTWALWKSWRLFKEDNSRLHAWQFKLRGKLRPAGLVLLALTLVGVLTAGWSGFVRFTTYRAQLAYQKLETPIDVILRPDYAPTPRDLDAAKRSLAFYARVTAPRDGGIGWGLRPDDWVNIAYLRLLLGDAPAAESALQRVIDDGKPRDSLLFQLEAIMRSRGATDADITALFQRALARHDDLFGVRDRLLRQSAAADLPKAIETLTQALARHPLSIDGPLIAAGFMRDAGKPDDALALVDTALARHGPSPDHLLRAAGVLASLNKRDRALELTERAKTLAQRDSSPRLTAAMMLAQMQLPEQALAAADKAVELSDKRGVYAGKAGALVSAALLNINLNRRDRGVQLITEALAFIRDHPWDLAKLGAGLVSTGMQRQDAALIEEGARILRLARDAEPAAPTIRHDLAIALYASGKRADALPEMLAAAELAPKSALLAQRYAELLREQGRADDAARWFAEAQKRAQNAVPTRP